METEIKNTITLQEAKRITDTVSFSTLIKPFGSLCNLNCKYCYYIDKERFYTKKQSIIADDILENYIDQYINSNNSSEITFSWHGGEPLLAGIQFYKKALNLQRKHNTKNKTISNTLQTNGVLINDEWCNFFKKNNFLIGISIDGPEDIYSKYRYKKNGESVFKTVIESIVKLKKYAVNFNTLSVINNMSESRGKEIYIFLKSLGVEYMQFLPSVDFIYDSKTYAKRAIISPFIGNSERTYTKAPWSVSATGYGQFLIDVFDEWIKSDVSKIFVQTFDMTLCAWCGARPPVCAYQESCGDVLTVEHNGDVYSCDHFVFPEYKLGNIKDSTLKNMLHSKKQISFGLSKRESLPTECLHCEFYFMCCGECPKHRHIPTKDHKMKYSLCDGVKMFYTHTKPYMIYMRDMLNQQKSPAYVMQYARQLIEQVKKQ